MDPRSFSSSPPRSPSIATPAQSVTSTLRVPLSRPPSSPRPRRRSSQQRVSLIAGRVSIAAMEPPPSPPSPPLLTPSLQRVGSDNGFLGTAVSTGRPKPSHEPESFLGSHSISDFVIQGELGRGLYGLVKRGRENRPIGSLGVRTSFSISESAPPFNTVAATSGNQAGYQIPD